MTADEIATYAREEARDSELEEDEGDPEWNEDDIEEIKIASDSNNKGTIIKLDTASNNLNNSKTNSQQHHDHFHQPIQDG